METIDRCEADSTQPACALTIKTAGPEALPQAILAEALDDPQSGLLILDAQLRLLHATSQIRSILGLSAEEPLAELDVYALLSRSGFDSRSIAAAKNHFADPAATASDSVVLTNQVDQGKIRMRLRNIGDGNRVVSFDSPSIQSVDTLEFALKRFSNRACLTPVFRTICWACSHEASQ